MPPLAPVWKGLFKELEGAQADPEVVAVVINGAAGRFSAGMDINALRNPALEVSAGRAEVTRQMAVLLEEAAKPSVAALEGMCLGAGLELALACSARLAAPGTSLGLPEVRLGLVPGLGGTQRLPRLLGLRESLRLMLGGVIVEAQEAAELGMVDGVAEGGGEALARQATALARALAGGEGEAAGRGLLLRREASLPAQADVHDVLAAARHLTLQRWVCPRAALLCLDAVQVGLESGAEAGMDKEGECFVAALGTSSHRALVRAFFAHRAAARAHGPRWPALLLVSLWTRVLALVAVLWEWWQPAQPRGTPRAAKDQ